MGKNNNINSGNIPFIEIRRADEIYEYDEGWVRGWWHFSFDQYYDEENMGMGVLRVFNHDMLEAGKAWPMHPHKDVEGISYIPSGEFEHADSLGNGGVLEKYGVQRMTLGSGAMHSERNHSTENPVEFIQMWIMPDEEDLKPEVEQKQFTKGDLKNKWKRILKPIKEDGDAVSVHQDASIYATQSEPGTKLNHSFGAGRVGYMYIIEGEVDFNGETLNAGDAVKVFYRGDLNITVTKNAHIILVDVTQVQD